MQSLILVLYSTCKSDGWHGIILIRILIILVLFVYLVFLINFKFRRGKNASTLGQALPKEIYDNEKRWEAGFNFHQKQTFQTSQTLSEPQPEPPKENKLSQNERALIHRFIGLWPSHKTILLWFLNKWNLGRSTDVIILPRGYFTLDCPICLIVVYGLF